MSNGGGSNGDSLLRLAVRGNRHAQAELLEKHRNQLRRMIAIRLDKRAITRADPSDIVQEAMKAALVRLPEYFADPRIPFYPWLRRIAWDRLMDFYRTHVAAEKRSVLKEQSWTPRLNDESVAELAQSIALKSKSPSEHAVAAEMHARVKAALLELRPPDREVLVLRYLEQLEVSEIAGVLGISETSVTSRHLRALQRLRQLLGKESEE